MRLALRHMRCMLISKLPFSRIKKRIKIIKEHYNNLSTAQTVQEIEGLADVCLV